MRAAVITVSDSCFRGQRVDVSGAVVSDLLRANAFLVISHLVVPDEQAEIEDALRQQELDAAAAAQAAPTVYDEPYGGQDGSYYLGTFRSRQGRHVNLRRIGTGPVSANSLQFRHANARVRR